MKARVFFSVFVSCLISCVGFSEVPGPTLVVFGKPIWVNAESVSRVERNVSGRDHEFHSDFPERNAAPIETQERNVSNDGPERWSTGRPEDNGFVSYTMKKGDTIRDMAEKMSPGQKERFIELAEKINRRDRRHFPKAGKSVLIPTDLDAAGRFAPIPVNNPNSRGDREVVVFLDIQYAGAYRDGALLFWYPVSTGRRGHETEPGKYCVNWIAGRDHRSSIDRSWLMPYAVNFTGSGKAIHEQDMPGYPASHGCVRTLMTGAKAFHDFVRVSDPITVIRRTDASLASN